MEVNEKRDYSNCSQSKLKYGRSSSIWVYFSKNNSSSDIQAWDKGCNQVNIF